MVKKAACLANVEMGLVPQEIGAAIVQACDDVIAGELLDQFIVDMIQGGAGTSTNMNANEVIANRALEHMVRTNGASHGRIWDGRDLHRDLRRFCVA